MKKSGRITDEKEIEKFVLQVLAKNKQACEDYKAGKQESLNFLLGEVMKASNRRADFQAARKVLIKLMK
jgi:aspartyl-tRNA(Asn)/glutamyl-tRNA(Gln) amidotransferase subunit B